MWTLDTGHCSPNMDPALLQAGQLMPELTSHFIVRKEEQVRGTVAAQTAFISLYCAPQPVEKGL